jgi:hypothetical protein
MLVSSVNQHYYWPLINSVRASAAEAVPR